VTEETVGICAVCAWRESCQKKFSISGKDIRCPDFVKDLSIRSEDKTVEDEKDQTDNPV
jgi:hypothetical protein